jgi:hypothetical protein
MEHGQQVHLGGPDHPREGAADGSILFADILRGVDGLIDKPPVKIDSEDVLKVIVMRATTSSARRRGVGCTSCGLKRSREQGRRTATEDRSHDHSN